MGFWDFFKRKKKENAETEKVSVDELELWILNKKAEIEKQEKQFLSIIKDRVSTLISEFEQELLILKSINVDEKKVEDKIKLIVKGNLKNYISYLEELVVKLRALDYEKEIIEKINSLFSNFQKRSAMNYEKATFIIGKELANTKESIKNFFKDTESILKENQVQTEKRKMFREVEKEFSKLNILKKIRSDVIEEIKNNESKILHLGDKIKEKEEEIKNVKESEIFIKENEKREKLDIKKQELERSIEKLREKVDFKALANFYHDFEREMSIIKAYKENFKQAFYKTKGEDLVSLLRESKLTNMNILDKIHEIANKEKEIKSIIIEKNEAERLEESIQQINREIDSINTKKSIEEKKLERLESNLNEIISIIKRKLEEINVKLD